MANLSGKVWNEAEDRAVARLKEMEDYLMAALTSDGPPYGAEKVEGRDLYDQLVWLRATGAPEYYGNPKAVAELMRLAAVYGQPPDLMALQAAAGPAVL